MQAACHYYSDPFFRPAPRTRTAGPEDRVSRTDGLANTSWSRAARGSSSRGSPPSRTRLGHADRGPRRPVSSTLASGDLSARGRPYYYAGPPPRAPSGLEARHLGRGRLRAKVRDGRAICDLRRYPAHAGGTVPGYSVVLLPACRFVRGARGPRRRRAPLLPHRDRPHVRSATFELGQEWTSGWDLFYHRFHGLHEHEGVRR